MVLLLRPLWLLLNPVAAERAAHAAGRIDARPGSRRLTGREIVVLSWAGTRGVISLAAIFTRAADDVRGKPFPGRDLILFCTYVVVVVTLVGQGVTFAPIVRALGVRADPADAASLRNEARAASVQAGLAWLDQFAGRSRGLPIRNWPGCAPASTAGCGATRSLAGARRRPTRTGRTAPADNGARTRPGLARPRWRRAGPSSTRSARNCCAGATPAACPTRACASWNANWTTRNASSPVLAGTEAPPL